jgi:hypothetical protein
MRGKVLFFYRSRGIKGIIRFQKMLNLLFQIKIKIKIIICQIFYQDKILLLYL